MKSSLFHYSCSKIFIIPLFQSRKSHYSVIPEKPRPLFHYSTAKISVILIPLFLFTKPLHLVSYVHIYVELFSMNLLFSILRRSSKTFARAQSSGVPSKELSGVKLRGLTREHISKNIPKFMIISVALMNFVMISNAFRERTCKHKSKRKSC